MDFTNNDIHRDQSPIIKNIIDTLTYYKKTTHPNISEVWINYIENKIYNKKLNEEELVFQYTNMINVIKNYPDMSLNNILLLSIITKIF